jgi:hypothetical protein
MLRNQLTALESRPKAVVNSKKEASLGQFSRVRSASGTLYDILKRSWSCLDKSHLRHSAKLCIESDMGAHPNTVTLDMAITYDLTNKALRWAQGFTLLPCRLLIRPSRNTQPPLVWLYVRADSTALPQTGQQTQPQFQGFVKALQNAPSVQNSLQHIFVPVLSGAANIAMRHLYPPIDASASASASSSIPTAPHQGTKTTSNPPSSSNTTDICKIKNVCSYFHSSLQGPSSVPNSQCLGYLQSCTDCKYLFYPPSTPKLISATSSANQVTSLIALIKRSQKRPCELLHQYQLALQISKAVLRFHSTAWMQAVWKLQDLSIFGTELSDQTLVTLHLSTYFESKPPNVIPSESSNTSPTNPISKLNNPSAISTLCNPGIYNETLFSLGIALLEISHWQPLCDMVENNDDEFNTAHRLVCGRAPLGPRFRKIVERCLRCDFSVDAKDLADVELQQAVWLKVVFPLESLIRETSQEI